MSQTMKDPAFLAMVAYIVRQAETNNTQVQRYDFEVKANKPEAEYQRLKFGPELP